MSEEHPLPHTRTLVLAVDRVEQCGEGLDVLLLLGHQGVGEPNNLHEEADLLAEGRHLLLESQLAHGLQGFSGAEPEPAHPGALAGQFDGLVVFIAAFTPFCPRRVELGLSGKLGAHWLALATGQGLEAVRPLERALGTGPSHSTRRADS